MRRVLLLSAAVVMSPFAAVATTLTVEVRDVESAQGQVYVGLCPRSFEEAQCVAGKRLPAKSGTMRFSFPKIAPGRYAVAAYHDVNGNGRLDKQTFGLPAEPYGFSNDVGRIAPPSHGRALVEVDGERATIGVRLARMKLTP